MNSSGPSGTPTLLDHVTPSQRVLVVSGSYGAGHDAAAREIRERLEERGGTVTVIDVADFFPLRFGHLLRWGYLAQMRYAPSTWETTLNGLSPGSCRLRLVQRMLSLATARLLERAAGQEVVISTHPFASQALGRARLDGRLTAILMTYLTDMSVHPLWVHPGVDVHLAHHEVGAQQSTGLGGRTVVIEPLMPRQLPASGSTRPSGLELVGPYVLICGGSLGIGELAETAIDLRLTSPHLTPVVLCGSNARLAQRLARKGIIAFGWRDDVSSLMAGAALVVTNAGGFMTKEALAVGAPLISYRCLPGHGRTNALAMEEADQAPYPKDRAQFASVVSRLTERPTLVQTQTPPTSR